MEYRYLGKSGLQLSAFSLGSWLTIGKSVDEKLSEKLMIHAYDNGVNFFDGAEVYANGQAEIVMGKVLKKTKWDRTSYVISSKVYFGLMGEKSKPNQRGLSRKHIMEACDAALKRMQLDYLDLYLCHRADKNTPMEEVVFAMNHLIQQGKIFYWGTSEWSAAEIMEAHMVAKQNHLIGPTLEQPHYNMFMRHRMEVDFLTIFKNIGMGTTVFSPLSSGLLTGKYNKEVPKNSRFATKGLEWLRDRELQSDKLKKIEKLMKIADKIDCKVSQLALAWCLKNPNVTTVILGASRVEQLKENLLSLKVVPLLNAEVMYDIDKVLENKPSK
jgi:voltage-dependent potassium channel beta subunit